MLRSGSTSIVQSLQHLPAYSGIIYHFNSRAIVHSSTVIVFTVSIWCIARRNAECAMSEQAELPRDNNTNQNGWARSSATEKNKINENNETFTELILCLFHYCHHRCTIEDGHGQCQWKKSKFWLKSPRNISENVSARKDRRSRRLLWLLQ